MTNFMVLDRAQMLPGPDGILGTADDVHQFTNSITPFIDQSQTYGSDPSHDAFLREYMIGADGKLHSTGRLLGDTPLVSATGGRPYLTGDLGRSEGQRPQFPRHQAHRPRRELVPLLATDAYGNAHSSPAPRWPRVMCRSSS